MEVRYLASHPLVEEKNERISITKGPLVDCIEEVDNPDVKLTESMINPESREKKEFQPNLFGGIMQLSLIAENRVSDHNWDRELYLPIESNVHKTVRNKIKVFSVPCFTWANRSPGAMDIWHSYF
jgi:hypothetical protein